MSELTLTANEERLAAWWEQRVPGAGEVCRAAALAARNESTCYRECADAADRLDDAEKHSAETMTAFLRATKEYTADHLDDVTSIGTRIAAALAREGEEAGDGAREHRD